MATITNAPVVRDDNGQKILADPHGNNVAILCPACEAHPVLLVARAGWRGSREDRAAECRGCEARVWMTNRVDADVEVPVVRIRFTPT